MKFFEDLLGLDPVWDCVQNVITPSNSDVSSEEDWGDLQCTQKESDSNEKINFNQTKKRLTFAEYMSLLSPFERKLLYSAYYEDFKVFGYNPCHDL